VFLYFGISQRRDEHLKVVLLLDLLEKRGPRAQRIAASSGSSPRVFVPLPARRRLVGDPRGGGQRASTAPTESLVFPMWPFLAALLVGFAFMAVTMFFQIYRQIQALRGRGAGRGADGAGPPD
jgi:TRAP-type C4-dicarboxylate transport system permease small subunit